MSRIAFSWTCHPNMNDEKAHNTSPLRNPDGPLGFNHMFSRQGWIWNVIIKVTVTIMIKEDNHVQSSALRSKIMVTKWD